MENVIEYRDSIEKVIRTYVDTNHLYLNCVCVKYKKGTMDVNDKEAMCGFVFDIIEGIGSDRSVPLIKIEFISDSKDILTIHFNKKYEDIIDTIKDYNNTNNIKVEYEIKDIKPLTAKQRQRRGKW